MGWRSVIITQHAKMTYSMNMMIVQTRDGINQIPIEDINLLLISTTQAVISTALISKLAQNQTKVVFVDEKDRPVTETVDYYSGARSISKLNEQFSWDNYKKESLWTKIVNQKITNQIMVLKKLMIMFDLPTETALERKEYRQFHKKLVNEGFLMIQYSVYARVCVTRKTAIFLENRVKKFLPRGGLIQSLMVTEKQYNDMHFLVGKPTDDVRNTSDRTVIL